MRHAIIIGIFKTSAAITVAVTLGLTSVACASLLVSNHVDLAGTEQVLRHVPGHISEFTPVAEPLAIPRCGDVRPPEALATPDPLLQFEEADRRIRVSFIVGADGRVHSPFILDSGGPRDDQMVLRVVRRWRYRPALCNGVPTDSEARVQFDIR
ncbi:MAG TPA: TonB family protein [Terriglobales bacterium]|nr:TonB family protein [Terriglobales bacterium]